MAEGIKLLDKKEGHAFGKDIVLLFQRDDLSFSWLEEPRWECSWYWSFGHVEEYTNNRHPEDSNDIRSHSHIDSLLWEARGAGSHFNHINEVPRVVASVMPERESWIIADLFKQYYRWSSVAEMLYRGTANLTSDGAAQVLTLPEIRGKHPLYNLVNGVILPRIMQRIMDLLHPDGKFKVIECPFLPEDMNAVYDMKVLNLV